MKQMKQENHHGKKYNCICCSYHTNKLSEYKRHIKTAKHRKNANETEKTLKCEKCGKIFNSRTTLWRHKNSCKIIKIKDVGLAKLAKNLPKISQSKFECECGKSYKHASSFSKHKKKCKYILQTYSSNLEDTHEIIPTNNVEELLKNIMLDNKAILEENKELRKEIKNLKLGNTNINSNNRYTINMFLNEKCKNAMNLEDFIDKLKFSLEDLQYTKENGYAKGLSNIFIKNLNDMDITERPIHCSDQKRLQFYVKDEDQWSKDKNNEKLDNTIAKVSKIQIKNLEKWRIANPDYLDSESKLNHYYQLVRNLTQPNDEKNLKCIKKRVGENVKIEKLEIGIDDADKSN